MEKEANHTWNAEDYAKHSSAQQSWAKELITKLSLDGDETILDIGCGDGKITAEIAAQLPGGSILGIDSSKDMVALAKESFSATNYPNLSFSINDARKLSFKERFDIVFSNAALHWIIDHKPVASGVMDSLKPGGRLLFQMGGKGNAGSIISTFETLMVNKEWQQYFSDLNTTCFCHIWYVIVTLVLDIHFNYSAHWERSRL